jgi:hypothetical protein
MPTMPDWMRIFPDADHRWIMGLRRTDSLADYFADADPSGAVRAERAHWLAEDPDKYAALLPAAELALIETVELAQRLGATVDSGQTPFGGRRAIPAVWRGGLFSQFVGAGRKNAQADAGGAQSRAGSQYRVGTSD